MKDYEVFRRWLGDVMDVIYGPSHNWPFKALEKEIKHGMMKKSATMKSREKVQGWIEEQKKKPKPKRARGKKGRYLADDPTTKDYNEAYVGGKAPKKKRKK